jgi:hypothetical protein
MVLKFDPQRVWVNVRKATTEDLLDRATVFRSSLEPEALAIVEEELKNRGVDQIQIQERAAQRVDQVLRNSDGSAAMCSFCRKPAVTRAWGWHRLFKRLPVFPRRFNYCEEHRPKMG